MSGVSYGPNRRCVLRLAKTSRLTYRQIAELVGLSMHTVGHYARTAGLAKEQMTPQGMTRAETVAAYRAGKTLKQIALECGVTAPAIRQRLIAAGEPRRQIPGQGLPRKILRRLTVTRQR